MQDFFAKGAPVDAKEVIDAKGNYVFQVSSTVMHI